jgi:hypothetical protein
MKFRRKNAIGARLALRLLAALLAATGSPVLAGMGTAVVPTQTIYPGEEITGSGGRHSRAQHRFRRHGQRHRHG